jgi:dTMP kinase
MRHGHFIVLEGVDGAGTTTHARRLCDALGKRMAVHETREPTAGPVGSLLRQALTGRLVTPGALGVRAPAWNTLALMFAADRMDHLEVEILPLLHERISVVCDRYYHSSIAYQSLTSATGEDTVRWIRELNRHARVPDLVIVLDVPPAVAAERRRRRPGVEIFDDDPLQARLCAFYAQLERYFPGENIVHVNSDRALEQVSADILAHVETALQSQPHE